MGTDTMHGEGFVQVPPKGGPQADRETTSERIEPWMGLSLAGRRVGRGGIAGSGDLHLPPPEHSCTVYCNQSHYGTVYGYVEESWVKGVQ